MIIDTLVKALVKLVGWILMPFGIVVIIFAWLGYGGFGVDTGVTWLEFLNDSLVWAITFTLVGGFLTALGAVMSRAQSSA